MERKCKRREAMTALINIKTQQRDQKHWWVWGSRMALARGVSGSGLHLKVSAVGGRSPLGGKREYAQTRQGQVRAFVLYLPDTENGRGNGGIPCNAMEMLSTPHRHHSTGPQALPNTAHGLCSVGTGSFLSPSTLFHSSQEL